MSLERGDAGNLTGIAQVQAGEEDQRLEAEHAQRPRQDHGDDVVEVRLLKLNGRNNTIVARLPAQPLRAALQNHRAIRLGQEDEKRPRRPCEDGAHPEPPRPRDDRDVACDGRTQDGAEGRRRHEACHAPPPALRVVVYVCAYPAHDADGAAASDADEEAEDDEGCEIGRDG